MKKLILSLMMVSVLPVSAFAASKQAAVKHETPAAAHELVVKHHKAAKVHTEEVQRAYEAAHEKTKKATEHSAK